MSQAEETDINGFYIPRLMHFLERPNRHGGMSPTWHMRLFRSGYGKSLGTEVRPAFLRYCRADKTADGLHDRRLRMPISEWTVRHNRWSDAEVEEQGLGSRDGRIRGKLSGGNPVEKKRFLRNMYDLCPRFVRPFCLFFYRYVLRCGFLDGTEGFIFYVLQTFWFRFLIDAKLFEQGLATKAMACEPPAPDGMPLERLKTSTPTPSISSESVPRNTSPMKILVLSVNYWPEETGIGPLTTWRCEYLASQGHDVTGTNDLAQLPTMES